MSAADHRRHSETAAAKARDHRGRFDPTTQVVAGPDRISSQGRWRTDYDYRNSGEDYYWGGGSYNPSVRHLTHAAQYEALAKKHRHAAESLEGFEEAQCGSFPPETRVQCPLLGQLTSAEDIEDGIRVRFADDIDMNAAVAHLRCHIAFSRARGKDGMDSCPLYLEDVRASRVGSSSEVDFQVEKRSDLNKLRRRMRTHVVPESR